MPYVENVPTTLYHGDGFEDELSSGRRLYRSDDAVYESRDMGRAGARIYEDMRGWTVKIRFPETDDTAAWDIYMELIDRAPSDIDLETDQRSFHTALENDGTVGVRDGGVKLRYNRESTVSVPQKRVDRLGGEALTFGEYLTKLVGGGGSAGALIGGGLGFALGGPAGAVPGAAMGGSLFGAGGLCAVPFVRQNHRWDGGYGRGKSTLEKKREGWTDRVNGWRARWVQRKDVPDTGLLEDINRRNALQAILPESEDYKEAENAELDRLEGKELDDTFGLLMDVHFREFEGLPGVTLTAKADTYGEAVDAITAYLDEDGVDVEEPSLYTSPDAFATMLSHLTYTDDGEQKLTDGGEALIANAMDRDDRPAPIDRFIDDRYENHLQRIAFNR